MNATQSRISRVAAMLGIALLTVVFASSLLAQKKGEKVAPVFANEQGIAINGYDAVSYFASNKPMKGKPAFAHQWNSATWHFASAENRDTFAKAPEKYAPQFGGYCAWAVSEGYTAPADPNAWKMVDGKLYLNYNAKVQGMWQQNTAERIRKADANWPSLHR